MDGHVMAGRRNRHRARNAGRRRRLRAVVAALGVAGAMLTASPLAAQAATPEPLEWRTPGTYTWRVPDGVTKVHVDVAGGSGGNRPISDGPYVGGNWGGLGGRVQGTLEVTPGTVLRLHVASAGNDGTTGGGSGSYGAGGSGYTSGGNGGSGSSVLGLSAGQGGGGGGGSSAISHQTAGPVPLVVAAGGGGAGGFAWCGGNPGGDAGHHGTRVPNSCASDGGNPGLAGATAGPGEQGRNARSSSGQGGGGGGGGGYRGGGGGDASTDGGGGGGGGTNYGHPALFTTESTGTATRGNGYVVLTPTYGTQTTFEHESYTVVAGQDLILNGTVGYPDGGPATPPQGTVELAAGAGDSWTPLATVPLDRDGRFTFTCSSQCPLEIDAAEVRAVYHPAQSRHWVSSSATAELEVITGATRTTLAVDAAVAVTGQARELTASVDVQPPAAGTATGEVQFWAETITGDDAQLIGTANLEANGQAVLTSATPYPGRHRVWATYSGSGWFDGSTSPRRSLVNDPAATETSAVTVPRSTVYGQDYQVHAEVKAVAPGAGTPSGEVEVAGQRAQLADGRAEITIPGGDAGSHGFTVRYHGDDRYESSETALRHVVDPADTEVILAQSAESSVYGETVQLSVEAAPREPGSGEVTGEVEILLDGEPSGVTGQLQESQTELTLDGLDAGSHAIEARYLGSANSHPATSETLQHEVGMAVPVVELAFDRESLTVGADAEVTVRVSAETGVIAEGGVEIRHATTGEVIAEGSLTDGEFTAAWSQPEVGEHTLAARYLGSQNVAAGESSEAVLAVTPAESVTTLDAPEQTAAGNQITVTARVEAIAPDAAQVAAEALTSPLAALGITADPSGARWHPFAPEGTVQFVIDGEAVGDPVALTAAADGGGEAVLRTTLDAGEHTVEARYSGEDRVTASASAPVTIAVRAADRDAGNGGPGSGGGATPEEGTGRATGGAPSDPSPAGPDGRTTGADGGPAGAGGRAAGDVPGGVLARAGADAPSVLAATAVALTLAGAMLVASGWRRRV